MTSSEIIRSALIKSGKSQAALAEFMGCSRQNLNIRLRKGTFTYNELEKALSFLGHRIVVLDDDGQSLLHYEIGRATCRERVFCWVYISVVAV